MVKATSEKTVDDMEYGGIRKKSTKKPGERSKRKKNYAGLYPWGKNGGT